MKPLCILPIAALISASPAPEMPPNGYFIPIDLIHKLTCSGPSGAVMGSGSYVDAHHILTAAHVAAGRTCIVGDQVAQTVMVDTARDVAVVRTVEPGRGRISFSCVKPKAGDEAFAIGFAGGSDFVVQRFTATGTFIPKRVRNFQGLAIFKGHAYRGMSGGPVIDRHGQIIGILNAVNGNGSMFGRLISETYLCGVA